MAGNLITSVLSLATKLLPSIRASAQAPSSSSNSNNSEKEHACIAEEDMESLMRTLTWIKATLFDAEEREISDRSVKLWLKELKKVAYDAEDVFSEYRYEVTRVEVEARKASQASGSHKRKQMQYIVPIPDVMKDRLNKLRSRFDEIAKNREDLQLRETDGVRHPNNKIIRPQTGHMVDEVSIFGRDAEISEIINFLSDKDKSFSIISIVGKGGLGKTTIAQLVYKNMRDSQLFDLFGWVYVSEEFDTIRLTKATIESISSKIDLSELSPLQYELAETVKGKTILLVLDDVWNENQNLWELFRVPFKEAKVVRILVTTRNKKVAEVMQTTCFSPTNLPEDSCWQLFQHYAFSGTNYTGQTLFLKREMGREIMRKCGGLPLAVKSIAGLLRYETNEAGWREILESDLWESNISNDIFPALQISFAHLPAHLKPCFLFCSMYPKDYILQKMNLIDLWISHGYIKYRGKRRITEIGVEYYEELKERSFLDNFSGQSSECCKLHDIIHDLARINSENEHYSVELNQPLDIQERNVLLQAHHLYVGGFVGYANQILQQNLKGLRTLSTDLRECDKVLEHEFWINDTEDLNLKLAEYYEQCSRNTPITDLSEFEALRVLDLKWYNMINIPPSIPKFKHLVYLSVTSLCLTMFPQSIGLLYNLQTFIIDCYSLTHLPESIGDLANLQLLNIQSSKVKKLPESLCSLSNLQRLVVKGGNLEEVPLGLKNLCNLHVLTVISSHIQALPNTISCLNNLEELNFCPPGGFVKDNRKLNYVPHGVVNFPAIKTLNARLRVRTIAWLKDMKDLEGQLYIEGLENMSNLVDAQGANLRNKCKLETLDLCWDSSLIPFINCYVKSELRLSLKREACEGGLVGVDDLYFSLLECLQPHPNLKKLRVRRYSSATLPGWISDPFSLESIQEVLLQRCDKIQSLPFGNLHTLKHLTIAECSSIRVLQLEQLPSQLEKLRILKCGHLESITGLGYLSILDELQIYSCQALTSITIDELKMVDSIEPFDNSSHEKTHIGQRSFSPLTTVEIKHCNSLHVLPHWRGCGCHDLQFEHVK